jgi:hypothetical protein
MKHLRPTKATPGLLCVPNGLKMYQTLLELYTSIDGITAGKSYILRDYFIFEKIRNSSRGLYKQCFVIFSLLKYFNFLRLFLR